MKTKIMILTALFAALAAVGAFIRIPAPLAPVTLQVMFMAFAGILLGAKYGALSQLIYIVTGLIGVPVFTEGGGLAYIFKPSFGFLLGLIAAAWVIGKLHERWRGGVWKIAAACAVGLAVLYLIGLPYMYLIFNVYLGTAMSVGKTLLYGCLLFLPGDALKILAVSLIAPKVAPALKLR